MVKTLESPAAARVRAVSEEPRRHQASTPSADPDWLLITSRRFPLAAACPLNPLLYLCQFLALPLKAVPWLVVPSVVGRRVRRAAAARRSRTDENRVLCTSPVLSLCGNQPAKSAREAPRKTGGERAGSGYPRFTLSAREPRHSPVTSGQQTRE